MRSQSPARPFLFTIVAFCIVTVSFFPSVLAGDGDRPPGERRQSLGAGLVHLAPESPVDGGAGLLVRYTRAMSAAAATGRKPFVLDISLSSFSLDRDAEGETQAGKIDILQVSAGITREVARIGKVWTVSAGGGLDYFSTDSSGSFTEPDPIAISNDYGVDSGLGFHAGVTVTAGIGKRSLFFFDLNYLAASLDGEHFYIIEGVRGEPAGVDFNLGGPRLSAGFSRTF